MKEAKRDLSIHNADPDGREEWEWWQKEKMRIKKRPVPVTEDLNESNAEAFANELKKLGITATAQKNTDWINRG